MDYLIEILIRDLDRIEIGKMFVTYKNIPITIYSRHARNLFFPIISRKVQSNEGDSGDDEEMDDETSNALLGRHILNRVNNEHGLPL